MLTTVASKDTPSDNPMGSIVDDAGRCGTTCHDPGSSPSIAYGRTGTFIPEQVLDRLGPDQLMNVQALTALS
jgi:hypothetical protein